MYYTLTASRALLSIIIQWNILSFCVSVKCSCPGCKPCDMCYTDRQVTQHDGSGTAELKVSNRKRNISFCMPQQLKAVITSQRWSNASSFYYFVCAILSQPGPVDYRFQSSNPSTVSACFLSELPLYPWASRYNQRSHDRKKASYKNRKEERLKDWGDRIWYWCDVRSWEAKKELMRSGSGGGGGGAG